MPRLASVMAGEAGFIISTFELDTVEERSGVAPKYSELHPPILRRNITVVFFVLFVSELVELSGATYLSYKVKDNMTGDNGSIK